MVTGIELKLECVKFKNHDKSNQLLEELIYRMNDILYTFSRKIISKTAKSYILKEFETIGTKAKELEDSPRKEEMLSALRHYYKVVRNAGIKAPCADDREEYMRLINYCIAKSIKAKKESTDVMLKQMSENKLVWDLYIKPFMEAKTLTNLDIKNFCNVQRELKELATAKYDFKYDDGD